MSEHTHRWQLSTGLTPVHGTCACGAERDFTNALLKNANGNHHMVIRPRRWFAPKAQINPGYWPWVGEQRLGKHR